MKKFILVPLLLILGCTSQTQIQKAVEEHPEWIFTAIEKNPEKFTELLQKVTFEARKHQQEKAEQEVKKQMEEDLKNPKTPEVADSRPADGPKDAPILLVEYSDFQCPFCQKGFNTVKQLKEKYKEKVRFVFKHFPLNFHPLAMPAALRYEAIAIQSPEKALKFHDEVFTNQNKLQDGEKFLDDAAKKVGANVSKMKKDMESAAVKNQIDADMKEASKFGISGTPGFVVNGVVIRGAYPIETFSEIIDKKLQAKN